MGKRHRPEEVVGQVRKAEVVLALSGMKADACRRLRS